MDGDTGLSFRFEAVDKRGTLGLAVRLLRRGKSSTKVTLLSGKLLKRNINQFRCILILLNALKVCLLLKVKL